MVTIPGVICNLSVGCLGYFSSMYLATGSEEYLTSVHPPDTNNKIHVNKRLLASFNIPIIFLSSLPNAPGLD